MISVLEWLEASRDTDFPLRSGDHLSLPEFLGRWEAMPKLRRAELIKGVVFMPSPVGREHGVLDDHVGFWLTYYAVHTPGCEPACNATWIMGDNAPQPDHDLRILPEYGGQSTPKGRLVAGRPEFVAEVCVTGAAYDLHQKLQVYQSAGVPEYLAVLAHERELRWHRLTEGTYQTLPVPADGVYRSAVYPGLWLNGPAFLAGDLQQVLATLSQGLAAPEHAAFVARLAAARRPS